VTSITIMDYVVVTFSTDSKELATAVAAEVAGAECTCCTHIEGPIRRVHRWHGRQHASEQWRVEIEATADGVDSLVNHLRSHHASDVHDLLVTDNIGHLAAGAAESR
jgi:uncharacterized protein involved in tolerance to divalent cations